MNILYVVGIGPGQAPDMTGRALAALSEADILCGYDLYVDLALEHFRGPTVIRTGMTRERERCRLALEEAARGRTVALVSGGDPGVYGMAGLAVEMGEAFPEVDIEIVPGVSAAMAGAALLGAPLVRDFAVVSLSDLLTPWPAIEARLRGAALADFVLCLYNPASKKRSGHLRRACDILLQCRRADTVCGWTRNVGRPGQEHGLCDLAELRDFPADMFTTVFVGCADTRMVAGKMATPRGYARPEGGSC